MADFVKELGGDIVSSYAMLRKLPDGRIIGTHRLLFHWTLHVGITPYGYDERYCYATETGATAACSTWDGVGDPEGWHRHPTSGRRRNPVTGVEWNDSDTWKPEFAS